MPANPSGTISVTSGPSALRSWRSRAPLRGSMVSTTTTASGLARAILATTAP